MSLLRDGTALVETAHHEIGDGITTLLAMRAADAHGVPISAVTVRLGDTSLPAGGLSGGSSTTTSLMHTLPLGCEEVRASLAELAVRSGEPLAGCDAAKLRLSAGRLVAPDGRAEAFRDIIARSGHDRIEALSAFVPPGSGDAELEVVRSGRLSLESGAVTLSWAFGAHFSSAP